jgi:hypothetical protein
MEYKMALALNNQSGDKTGLLSQLFCASRETLHLSRDWFLFKGKDGESITARQYLVKKIDRIARKCIAIVAVLLVILGLGVIVKVLLERFSFELMAGAGAASLMMVAFLLDYASSNREEICSFLAQIPTQLASFGQSISTSLSANGSFQKLCQRL